MFGVHFRKIQIDGIEMIGESSVKQSCEKMLQPGQMQEVAEKFTPGIVASCLVEGRTAAMYDMHYTYVRGRPLHGHGSGFWGKADKKKKFVMKSVSEKK